MVQMTNFVALRNGGGVDPRDKRVKDRVGFSDVGNRGSYTPGDRDWETKLVICTISQ